MSGGPVLAPAGKVEQRSLRICTAEHASSSSQPRQSAPRPLASASRTRPIRGTTVRAVERLEAARRERRSWRRRAPGGSPTERAGFTTRRGFPWQTSIAGVPIQTLDVGGTKEGSAEFRFAPPLTTGAPSDRRWPQFTCRSVRDELGADAVRTSSGADGVLGPRPTLS